MKDFWLLAYAAFAAYLTWWWLPLGVVFIGLSLGVPACYAFARATRFCFSRETRTGHLTDSERDALKRLAAPGDEDAAAPQRNRKFYSYDMSEALLEACADVWNLRDCFVRHVQAMPDRLLGQPKSYVGMALVEADNLLQEYRDTLSRTCLYLSDPTCFSKDDSSLPMKQIGVPRADHAVNRGIQIQKLSDRIYSLEDRWWLEYRQAEIAWSGISGRLGRGSHVVDQRLRDMAKDEIKEGLLDPYPKISMQPYDFPWKNHRTGVWETRRATRYDERRMRDGTSHVWDEAKVQWVAPPSPSPRPAVSIGRAESDSFAEAMERADHARMTISRSKTFAEEIAEKEAEILARPMVRTLAPGTRPAPTKAELDKSEKELNAAWARKVAAAEERLKAESRGMALAIPPPPTHSEKE